MMAVLHAKFTQIQQKWRGYSPHLMTLGWKAGSVPLRTMRLQHIAQIVIVPHAKTGSTEGVMAHHMGCEVFSLTTDGTGGPWLQAACLSA